MKTFIALAAALVLVVGVFGLISADPVEAATPRTVAIPHVSPEKFDNLIINRPITGECDWDFPALTDSRLQLATVCAETATCAAPGAVIGDACLAASNLGADGGAALASTATLRCRTLTNGIVFQLCNLSTDAGSYDLGDAGFYGRAIH